MTRKHKRFVKDCMGWLGMSRNCAEQIYRAKDFEYVNAVCDIKIKKGFARATKVMLDLAESMRRLCNGSKNFL